MPAPTASDKIFMLAAKNRAKIITLFKVLYLTIAAIIILGVYSLLKNNSFAVFFYTLGVQSGQAAILVYIITTIPGITRRFKISHRLIQILMMFRRYIGILMYSLILNHYMMVSGTMLIFKQILPLPFPVFELFGIAAFTMLFLLFITSNDFSVKRLGIWWDRLHQLTYVIVWLIFAHVALQRLSIWTLLIGVTAVAQISSHLYVRMKMASISPSNAS